MYKKTNFIYTNKYAAPNYEIQAQDLHNDDAYQEN